MILNRPEIKDKVLPARTPNRFCVFFMFFGVLEKGSGLLGVGRGRGRSLHAQGTCLEPGHQYKNKLENLMPTELRNCEIVLPHA